MVKTEGPGGGRGEVDVKKVRFSTNNLPRIERITTTKSKTFHGSVK